MRLERDFLLVGYLCMAACATSATSWDSASVRGRCQAQANGCAAALIAERYEAFVDCMPEIALALNGGRTATVDLLKRGRREMESNNQSIVAGRYDAPSELREAGGKLFAILHGRVTVAVREGRLDQRSFMIGVSSDKGVTWRFVDGVRLNTNNVRRVFPDFPQTLKLPVVGGPTFTPSPGSK